MYVRANAEHNLGGVSDALYCSELETVEKIEGVAGRRRSFASMRVDDGRSRPASGSFTFAAAPHRRDTLHVAPGARLLRIS